MTQIHLLGLCGALRSGSTNRLLLQEFLFQLFSPALMENPARQPVWRADVADAGTFCNINIYI